MRMSIFHGLIELISIFQNKNKLTIFAATTSKMVTEEIIEQVISKFESDQEAYVEALSDIMDGQPALLAFLSQESNDVLTEDEKDVLWYIILILITSTRKSDNQVGELSDVVLGNNEESNWEILQVQPKGTFRERVTIFFDEYEQEDLLAFVEDTLELDDDSPVTSVGREVIFVSAKAIIDTMFSSEN